MSSKNLDALLAKANALFRQGKFTQALAAYEDLIVGLRQLINDGQTELQPSLLRVQMSRATTLNSLNRLPEALAAYDDVIAGYQLISDSLTELRKV